MRSGIRFAMALALAATGRWKLASAGEETPEKQPTAAGLVREVYSAEAWMHQVDSCLIRTKAVQFTPRHREATPAPSAAELDDLRSRGDWEEAQRWTSDIAWDRTRVRSTHDYAALEFRMATAWDGRILTVHHKDAPRSRESYGIYDDSRRYELLTHVVNLWDYGGLVTNDRNAWWRSRDPEEGRRRDFTLPEDFRLVATALVDRRDCHVVESRAGRLRLYIDAAERRVRRITLLGLPNDLDEAVRLAAMRRASDIELAAPGDWGAWVEKLDPGERLAAERRLHEDLFPSMRVRAEIYPADHARVAAAGWMPRRYTRISSYPDWDVVEKTGKYTYKVDRVDVEVTELRVNEPLTRDALAIEIPEGGKVYDWRFDPPAEYDFRKDRTEEQIRAIAEEARRRRDEEQAPYREMAARIEKRVGEEAPGLPRGTWFNGEPLELAGLRGRVVLLHFWATWCAPCHNDIRTLVALRKSPTSDPLVIGVHDARSDIDAVKKEIADKGIRYPVCIDLERDTGDGVSLRSWYRIRGIPYTILIDRKGRVAAHGTLDDMLEKASGI